MVATNTSMMRSSNKLFLFLPLLLLLLAALKEDVVFCWSPAISRGRTVLDSSRGQKATAGVSRGRPQHRSLSSKATGSIPARGIHLFASSRSPSSVLSSSSSSTTSSSSSSSSWFADKVSSVEQGKASILQVGAALDRGQSYNPTSGEYYGDRMEVARDLVAAFVDAYPDNVPATLKDIEGEWELVFSTVPHGIFRSSPFFLAIQESYEEYAEEKESFGMRKADLFFKLHELQTCSWGASKIGRVAQFVSPDSGYLYSEFDTSIFSLTVIPILGWFKLLPTFGGCVVTAAKAEMADGGRLDMQVDYTTARKVPGLNGLGEWIWKVRVPVGAIWKLLPWNKGRDATCKVYVRYCDGDFRIVQDVSGDYFVYTRPVIPRPLDLFDGVAETVGADGGTE